MVQRRSRRTATAVFVTLVLAIGIGFASVAPGGASVRTANILGTKTPAKGTPVKIGLISDDQAGTTDNSIETPVTNAAVARPEPDWHGGGRALQRADTAPDAQFGRYRDRRRYRAIE